MELKYINCENWLKLGGKPFSGGGAKSPLNLKTKTCMEYYSNAERMDEGKRESSVIYMYIIQ